MDTPQNPMPETKPADTYSPASSSPTPQPVTPENGGVGQTPPKSDTQWGPIIGIIIIIALLVLGGLYYWKEKGPSGRDMGPSADEIMSEQDSVTASLETQSDSSSLSSIEADLNATNLEGIDTEAGKADLELQ